MILRDKNTSILWEILRYEYFNHHGIVQALLRRVDDHQQEYSIQDTVDEFRKQFETVAP